MRSRSKLRIGFTHLALRRCCDAQPDAERESHVGEIDVGGAPDGQGGLPRGDGEGHVDVLPLLEAPKVSVTVPRSEWSWFRSAQSEVKRSAQTACTTAAPTSFSSRCVALT